MYNILKGSKKTTLKRTIQRMLLMATTLLVVACSGVEDSAMTSEETRPADMQTVDFSAYVNRATTRGGYEGSLSLATLKEPTAGFGVFAYYTDSRVYSQMSLPNFMYNQQVTFNSLRWTYSPIKYWPNETGSKGSEETDRLTFFAYAPYTEVDATTARATERPTTGIVGLSRTIDSGDPYVRYFASLKPSEVVDLCWATPQIDQTKPEAGTNVMFNFMHALSALNVQIDADIDVPSHSTSSLDSYTRIWVRSITFRGFAERGQLNLNNNTTTPRWNNLDCDCDLTSGPITIYDGRRDDREGMAASLNELHTGLNPAIVQSDLYTVSAPWNDATYSTTPGVTNTQVNLFDPTGVSGDADDLRSAPIYVIPTNESMFVTIVYDVETYDPKLTSQYLSDGRTHGSTIENNISAYITNGSGDPLVMQAGKQYNIHLHLGMTSVKVDADVTDWVFGANAHVEVPK